MPPPALRVGTATRRGHAPRRPGPRCLTASRREPGRRHGRSTVASPRSRLVTAPGNRRRQVPLSAAASPPPGICLPQTGGIRGPTCQEPGRSPDLLRPPPGKAGRGGPRPPPLSAARIAPGTVGPPSSDRGRAAASGDGMLAASGDGILAASGDGILVASGNGILAVNGDSALAKSKRNVGFPCFHSLYCDCRGTYPVHTQRNIRK